MDWTDSSPGIISSGGMRWSLAAARIGHRRGQKGSLAEARTGQWRQRGLVTGGGAELSLAMVRSGHWGRERSPAVAAVNADWSLGTGKVTGSGGSEDNCDAGLISDGGGAVKWNLGHYRNFGHRLIL
ncbi:unnamed protein product [Cuscuta epithymum]|uniref:Uncharacterized protein n=1 Tax=Cuscuta epithymum TaxID=186058 RepID=A0AAV0G8J3_9ASTE|nr:unnamed protein product [Cuscuta epithymum]